MGVPLRRIDVGAKRDAMPMDMSVPTDAAHDSSESTEDFALRAEIGPIAEMAAGLFTDGRCRIMWQCGTASGVCETTSVARGDPMLDAVLAVLARYPGLPSDGTGVLSLGPEALTGVGRERSNGIRFEAAAASVGFVAPVHARATVALIAPVGHRGAELKAAAQLAARATLSVMRSASGAASREFWQRRASDTAARLSHIRAEATALAAQERRIAQAFRAATKLRPRYRFAGLGSIFAGLGPFEAWIVATEWARAPVDLRQW
jgi:hypothetical protein